MSAAVTRQYAGDLSPSEREVQGRAREFTDQVLIPLEEQAELAGGPLPPGVQAMVRDKALEFGLHGGRHRREHGGNGWSTTEWYLTEEQFGRCSNGISWYIPSAYNVWRNASPELIDRWLRPALRGALHDAYAVTEADAGSDPSGITTSAVRDGDGWRITGEKWFVTFGSVAAVLVVMANAMDGDEVRPTLFAVPADAAGIKVVADVPFTHSFPHGHPTISFEDVWVSNADVIGGVGDGDDLQRQWFTEERLAIAARCGGAMLRLLDEGIAWTQTRIQGGHRILDHQGVAFPLADSAADAAAGRLLGLTVAQMVDAGFDAKVVHGKASTAKLFCSEAAYRCADRVVQVFGGRGYMRTNIAERLLRELRVDRIWEGTSEIQRLIVARSLDRRGVEATVW